MLVVWQTIACHSGAIYRATNTLSDLLDKAGTSPSTYSVCF